MPNVLIIDDSSQNRLILKTEFEKQKNLVKTNPLSRDATKLFKEFVPDLVLINCEGEKKMINEFYEDALVFDYTSCLVGMTSKPSESLKNEYYTKGARAIISLPSPILNAKDAGSVMNQMYEMCNELKLAECIGCWKTGRFGHTLPMKN